MLTKRIIACLDVRDGRVVKGVQFRNHRDMGDILVWALYTTTILSILLISGLYFTDSNFMKSDSIRIGSGIFIIIISIVNLISRLYDF